MKIDLEEVGGDRFALDDAGGEFYPAQTGQVLYKGPGEAIPWYVNSDLSKFHRSVAAYERYIIDVVRMDTESGQLMVVSRFRDAILDIEDYGNQEHSYWACIVQQAEEGQL